jgi:hypothetical protein
MFLIKRAFVGKGKNLYLSKCTEITTIKMTLVNFSVYVFGQFIVYTCAEVTPKNVTYVLKCLQKQSLSQYNIQLLNF